MEADRTGGLQGEPAGPAQPMGQLRLKAHMDTRPKKNLCFISRRKAEEKRPRSKTAEQCGGRGEFLFTHRSTSLSVLLGPSPDWVRPTHTEESNLLH